MLRSCYLESHCDTVWTRKWTRGTAFQLFCWLQFQLVLNLLPYTWQGLTSYEPNLGSFIWRGWRHLRWEGGGRWRDAARPPLRHINGSGEGTVLKQGFKPSSDGAEVVGSGPQERGKQHLFPSIHLWRSRVDILLSPSPAGGTDDGGVILVDG